MSDKKNNSTVIRPSRPKPLTKTSTPADPPNPKAIKKASPGIATDQARALTQISNAIKKTNNSTGFEKARQAANMALANKKIIIKNRFVLDTIIGGGGMGTVYKARDLRKVEANDVNPFVAVKVLNDEFQQHPDAFVTLQRETSRSQTLAHPNIITVHDFDRDGSLIYMTMELLEGMDLESYIHSTGNHGVPLNKALSIIEDYCNALIYAHGKHVVHSDLKPGNIFLTEEGAKVLDFGIARLSPAGMSASEDHFDAGSLGALTPAYASLEMLNGEPPDPSDDVYAAAIIAYELLSGQHPYQRKSAVEALEAGLKPARISKLSNRQWRTLDAALKLRRSERTATVAQVLHQVKASRKSFIWKVAALGFIVISALLAYFQFIVPDEMSTAIADTLKKGQQCLAVKDYACTRESATTVLELDAENKVAKTLLQTSIEAAKKAQIANINQSALSCIEEGDLNCARAEVVTLKRIAPDSPSIADIETKLKIKVAGDSAELCMTKKHYDCVLQNTDTILSLEPENSEALSLKDQAKQLKVAQQQLEIKRQQKKAEKLKLYKQHLASAKKCFSAGNYECSKASAKKALTYKPADINAETIFQKASFAQMQQQQAELKAKSMTAQGKQCLKQKNYSCAIAKSESALEFLPGFVDAIRLKQQAQQEVTRLKHSIKIE